MQIPIKPQPGKYGKTIKDGICYQYLYSFKARILIRIIKAIQNALWKMGIAVHDPIFNECTSDFNCCNLIGRKAILRINKKAWGLKND